MIQKLLHSKNLIACLLAAATGMTFYFRVPFPENNFFLELIFLWSRSVFRGLQYSYYLFLYTTPYIVYSLLLSGLYIFAIKFKRRIRPGTLPPYPLLRDRQTPSLVIGEVHDPRKPVPLRTHTGLRSRSVASTPASQSWEQWAPARQVAACSLRRAAHRLQSPGQDETHRRPRTRSQRRFLPQGARNSGEAWTGRGLHRSQSALRVPLQPPAQRSGRLRPGLQHRGLLNNLFGKGKEPFWQQAYTNLVKFIILLHKVAYDYVTLFDVYECAISPEVLEKRIEEAEEEALEVLSSK